MTESLPLKLTVNASMALYKIISELLFENPESEDRKERHLPFGVKAKLQQAGITLEKDYIYYENERERLIKEYGETVDGKTAVKEENISKFKEDLTKILKMEVTHYNLPKFKISDLDMMDADTLSLGEVELFMTAFLDPESVKDAPATEVVESEEAVEEK